MNLALSPGPWAHGGPWLGAALRPICSCSPTIGFDSRGVSWQVVLVLEQLAALKNDPGPVNFQSTVKDMAQKHLPEKSPLREAIDVLLTCVATAAGGPGMS